MNYTSIIEELEVLEPVSENRLRIQSICDRHIFVGWDFSNCYCIFFEGCNLKEISRLSLVREHLRSQTITRVNGERLEGTLLQLQSGESDKIAIASIAAEFMRRGVPSSSIEDIFPQLEKYIERQIEDAQLSSHSMIGLIGELLVYSKLLSAIKKHLPENPPDLINIWQGWGNTARDFCFYRLDLEVKTTLRSSRIHHIGGFHQIEVSKREDGTADSIYLISVGLRPDPLDGDYSVVSLTEDILKQLSPDDQRAFLNNLRRYGQRSGDRGYDHETMSEDPKYLRKYSIQLEAKAYDVSDPEVKILRRDDIERSEFRDVVTNSVSFKIKLKDSDYSFNRDRIPQYNPLRLVEALDLLIPKHTPRAHPQ